MDVFAFAKFERTDSIGTSADSDILACNGPVFGVVMLEIGDSKVGCCSCGSVQMRQAEPVPSF
jgi:hypothetical protein